MIGLREPAGGGSRRLVEKGSLYRSLRSLRGQLEWEGDIDSARADRTARG